MFELLWGLKTIAAFDVWSIEHILSGLSVGHSVKKNNVKHTKRLNPNVSSLNKTVMRYELLVVLFIAYLWETIEHYLEQGLGGAWLEYWFQGTEMWANRLITDPLMLVVGYYFIKKYPFLVIPARILSVLWIAVHLIAFPHSMYLHSLL